MVAPTGSCEHVRSYQTHAPQAHITSRSDISRYAQQNISGLIHLAQNKNTRVKQKKKEPLFLSKMIEKAVFKVEILADFHFYVCFLAAIPPSAVLLYGDDGGITSSASE